MSAAAASYAAVIWRALDWKARGGLRMPMVKPGREDSDSMLEFLRREGWLMEQTRMAYCMLIIMLGDDGIEDAVIHPFKARPIPADVQDMTGVLAVKSVVSAPRPPSALMAAAAA